MPGGSRLRGGRSDFVSEASIVASSDQTQIDGIHLGIDKRRYRRIGVVGVADLIVAGARAQGPAELSRSGVGLVVALQPAVGAAARVELPADEDDPDALAVDGRIVRVTPICAPIERTGVAVPTFHCFACGWTGFIDARGRLESVVQRSDETTFAGDTRVGESADVGAPSRCPTCGERAPAAVSAPLFHVGIALAFGSRSSEQRLLERIERLVIARGEAGKRRMRRVLAQYVPLRIECRFDRGSDPAGVFLRDMSQGGIRFSSKDGFRLGDEVRICILIGETSPFVAVAQIVSCTAGDVLYYTARFSNFSDQTREELRQFIDGATGRAVQKTDAKVGRQKRRRRLSRDLVLGLTVGFLVALAAALIVATR